MDLSRAKELMAIERACVQRANTCGRDCAHCDLVQEDQELTEAYDLVIQLITALEIHRNGVFDDEEAFEYIMRGETP